MNKKQQKSKIAASPIKRSPRLPEDRPEERLELHFKRPANEYQWVYVRKGKFILGHIAMSQGDYRFFPRCFSLRANDLKQILGFLEEIEQKAWEQETVNVKEES